MKYSLAQESHLDPVYPVLHVQSPLLSVQLASLEPAVIQLQAEITNKLLSTSH